jgi:hypothetical protein
MKNLTLVLIVFTVLLSGAYLSANADTLYTSALFGPTGDTLYCMVTNVSNLSVSVTITIYEDTGLVVSGPINLPVAEKAVRATAVYPNAGHSYFCKFSTADKSKVRANGFVQSGADSRISAIVEAR